VLRYYLHQHPDLPLTAVESTVGTDHYGFAIAKGSPLRGRINVTLLKLRETRVLQQIAARWSVD